MAKEETDRGRVAIELIRGLLAQLRTVLTVNVVNAALVAAVLARSLPTARVYAWAAAVVVLAAARFVLLRRYDRGQPSDPVLRRCATLAVAGSGISGLLWGLGGVVLFPPDVLDQMLLVFVLGGMAAGATATLAAYPAAFHAYLLPSLLPFAARLYAEGPLEYRVMAAMVIVFAAALSVIARSSHRTLARAVVLRLALEARTEELRHANEQLRIETAEKWHTEEALRQAQKMEAIGQLTGGVAHDFNNLLTVLLGDIELAQQRTADREVLRFLAGARHAAERGSRLVQQLLAFSRKQALQPGAVDLNRLVAGMIDLLERSLGRSVRVERAFAGDLWPALVDANQIELVILNIGLNARDAMPEGGTLRIATANLTAAGAAEADRPAGLAPGDYVRIALSDTGTGMPPEVVEQAFEPFFTTKAPGKGSGLGLSQVYGVARQSGGGAEIESMPGRGTTVTVYLPRAARHAAAMPPPPVAAPAGSGILVVDDDPQVLHVMSATLGNAGYRVLKAESGDAALALLAEPPAGAPIDLMVTDFTMPGMDGGELTLQARRHRPRLPVLCTSGQADLGGMEAIGDVHVLTKPFHPADLADRVARMLAEAKAHSGAPGDRDQPHS